jgi:hypothetical protein
MNTREFNLSGFNRIAVKFVMELEVVRSEAYNISITGNDNFLDNLDVYAEAEKLVLGYRFNILSFFNAFSRASVRINMPELRELDIAMAARGRISGFKSSADLAVNAAGASKLELLEMSAGSAKWDLSGASHVDGRVETQGNTEIKIVGASHLTLHGRSGDLKINAAGASHVDLADYPVKNAAIRLSGASHCKVNLDGKLDASLEGASRLEYLGRAVLGDLRTAGASSVKQI